MIKVVSAQNAYVYNIFLVIEYHMHDTPNEDTIKHLGLTLCPQLIGTA